MTPDAPGVSSNRNWLDASGLPHILRAFGFALHSAKLGLSLGLLIATFFVGGTLDWLWTRGSGIDEQAIARFIAAHEMDRPYEEPAGAHGVFHVWREHEQRCILGLLDSCVPGLTVAAGTPLATTTAMDLRQSPLRLLAGMGYGVLWMLLKHPVYFLLFGGVMLLVWAWGGGAICRIAALQFARDEKLTARQALAFAGDKLIGGFVLAPCIPIALGLLVAVGLILGGLLLRVWLLGDVLVGLTFGLAILGGLIIATLAVGTVVGGGLFWPAVAVEGSDAFDAFSRSLSFPLSKPWKTLLYGTITLVLAGVAWTLVRFFVYIALAVTRGLLAVGASHDRMELLWPLHGADTLYSWPEWSQLAWYQYPSAFFVLVYVLLVIGLLWSFLISFFFSSCTVVYFLLRRDVDGTDLEEIQWDEEAEGGDAQPAPTPAPPANDV